MDGSARLEFEPCGLGAAGLGDGDLVIAIKAAGDIRAIRRRLALGVGPPFFRG